MIRNLKILVSAVAVLTALDALGASGVHAAEFHCSVEPCRVTLKPDGTGKTAHQVFIIRNAAESVSFTCASVSGEATMATKTKKELTVTNVEYQGCFTIGTEARVKMNECDYLFGAEGEFSIKCPAGKKIEWIVLGCTATIGEQGPLPGMKYHDAGITKSELTVETAVAKVKGPSMLAAR
jgi:hypothetical protein